MSIILLDSPISNKDLEDYFTNNRKSLKLTIKIYSKILYCILTIYKDIENNGYNKDIYRFIYTLIQEIELNIENISKSFYDNLVLVSLKIESGLDILSAYNTLFKILENENCLRLHTDYLDNMYNTIIFNHLNFK